MCIIEYYYELLKMSFRFFFVRIYIHIYVYMYVLNSEIQRKDLEQTVGIGAHWSPFVVLL